MELKSGEGTVVVADRDCCCNYGCNRNSGWGSGWGAVGGALVGGGFGAAAVSVWDKINDTAKDQEIARLNRVVDAQRDQNIIQSVVAALKTTPTPA